ncbi:hypothetical protein RLOC_00009882 [Lonchura striata]|uniref:Uncharacterized protein n=1 Tax=Lonchura striata TaxID=40157 RepID=A0A218V9G4_9PASE|nr:hypothetical protein RLOC_00009882 [Lonchura striata domestica]
MSCLGARAVRHWPLPILEPDKCWNKALLCRQVCEVETNVLWSSYCFPGDRETWESWPARKSCHR